MLRFPHFAFRAAVVISLAGLALQAAVEHAARETICCAYRPLIIIADLLEAFPRVTWGLNLCALIGLSIVALYAPVGIFVAIALGRRADIYPVIIDTFFGVGATIGLYFAWVVAMGHSEPSWARGFRATWLTLVAISGATLFLTRNQSKRTRLRVVVWVGGLLIAAVVPVLMTSVQSISDQGEVFHERHATSTKYVFAVLITCLFWIADVCLSRSPARQAAPATEG